MPITAKIAEHYDGKFSQYVTFVNQPEYNQVIKLQSDLCNNINLLFSFFFKYKSTRGVVDDVQCLVKYQYIINYCKIFLILLEGKSELEYISIKLYVNSKISK